MVRDGATLPDPAYTWGPGPSHPGGRKQSADSAGISTLRIPLDNALIHPML